MKRRTRLLILAFTLLASSASAQEVYAGNAMTWYEWVHPDSHGVGLQQPCDYE